jgi:histidinol-phosphate phosphatase family protein
MEKHKAVFIDRDGTINVNIGYLNSADKFKMYSGVAEGIKLLNDEKFKVVIITNQSGIARGYFNFKIVEQIHARLKKELAERTGAFIDAIYICPHHPTDNCRCRKPRTALFELAVKDLDIDILKSYVIGDRMLDVEAGYRIGCKTVLVPEKGNEDAVAKEMCASAIKPTKIVKTFYTAVQWVIEESKKSR